MTLKQYVRAYMALNTLMDKECDFKTAYTLSKLHARLKPSVEFFIKKEQELVNEFAGKDSAGAAVTSSNGQFLFAKDKDPAEFTRLHNDLENVEVDEDVAKERIKAPESISASNLMALEEFLDFTFDD